MSPVSDSFSPQHRHDVARLGASICSRRLAKMRNIRLMFSFLSRAGLNTREPVLSVPE